MAEFETMAKKVFIRQYETTGVRPVGFVRLTWWVGLAFYAAGLTALLINLATGDLRSGLAFAMGPFFAAFLFFVLRNNALLAAGAALLLADQGDVRSPPSQDADRQAEAQDISSSEEGSTGGASFSLRRSSE